MNRGRILVVDDDPNIRFLLTASLEFEGLEVQTAPDGATAL
jgi:two-component system OmpR family response regulator